MGRGDPPPQRAGRRLADLKKRIADLGLSVESAIGFPSWAVDDDAQREKGMEQMKREMDLVAQIGGRRIAAPPAGVNNNTGMDLRRIGERYRAVLELGRQMGVVPQLEIWGSAKTLGRVSEAAFVAIEANHADACLLLDVYHIYKSGVGFGGLRLLNGRAMHVLHINDYPADPPREKVTDADRVYPGDGVAPLPAILGDLLRRRLPRRAVAGTLQPRVLEAGSGRGGQDGPGEDQGGRGEDEGVRQKGGGKGGDALVPTLRVGTHVLRRSASPALGRPFQPT